MGEISDPVALHLEIDRDGRAAQLGVGGGAGVRIGQPTQPGNIPGQLQNPAIVDLVQHGLKVAVVGAAASLPPASERIYRDWLALASSQLGLRLRGAERSAAAELCKW